jgi:uncharacterized membrane protein
MVPMVTTTSPPATPRHPLRLVRVIKARPRLFLSGLLGLAVIAVLAFATTWRVATIMLVGWDIGIALYLLLAIILMHRSDVHRIRRRAAIQDENQLTMLALTVAAAAASLVAIFAELGTVPGAAREPAQLIVATVTIVLSWAFIHAMFALHYAHEFYGDGRDRKIGGMTFPGDDEPDYLDFTYFSFTIGMCAQVSDVTVSSKAIRRVVLSHSIVSFLFNAALLALTVNIAASAI